MIIIRIRDVEASDSLITHLSSIIPFPVFERLRACDKVSIFLENVLADCFTINKSTFECSTEHIIFEKISISWSVLHDQIKFINLSLISAQIRNPSVNYFS